MPLLIVIHVIILCVVMQGGSKALDEMELSPPSPPTVLDCEPQQHFTQGIEVTQVTTKVS